MREIELKPCPFCGGEAVMDYGNGIKKYWACCNNPKCRVQPMTEAHEKKHIVRRYWNGRADNEQRN